MIWRSQIQLSKEAIQLINQVYQLVSPRQFEVAYKNEDIYQDQVVIRPLRMAVCAADQRYYTGSRDKNALDKKLPMALTHEGVGEVAFDNTNTFELGTKVLMVPNTPVEEDETVSENYLKSSQFRSSGLDGFMQDYVLMEPDRLVEIPESVDLDVMAYSELVSVSWHAIQRFNAKAIEKRDSFGIWGDGNLGYITSVLLRQLYPEARIYVFGKTDFKLNHFSFADETYDINHIPDDLTIDHGFECAGGKGSQAALEQIVDHINPEGAVALLGVSEYPIEVNTRLVLEKGLTLIGSSRSSAQDFADVVDLYQQYPEVLEKLSILKGKVFEIKQIEDISKVFEEDLNSTWGKTVVKWTL